jgi:hypothetical protein
VCEAEAASRSSRPSREAYCRSEWVSGRAAPSVQSL